MPDDVKTLYHEDLLAWSKGQAEALRSAARGGSNQALDWENLAEEIEALLERDPSLRGELASTVAGEHKRGARKAIAGLERYRELEPAIANRIRATTYTAEQILGDWLPPDNQG